VLPRFRLGVAHDAEPLCDGDEVYPVVGGVGGTPVEAHPTGLDRSARASGKPASWAEIICEP
jgi:hypothetical protein